MRSHARLDLFPRNSHSIVDDLGCDHTLLDVQNPLATLLLKSDGDLPLFLLNRLGRLGRSDSLALSLPLVFPASALAVRRRDLEMRGKFCAVSVLKRGGKGGANLGHERGLEEGEVGKGLANDVLLESELVVVGEGLILCRRGLR